jgi:hypothetical protein
VHARGRNGIPLTVTTDMAPFVDLNGDGLYQPFEGEYPDVPGDEAMWWVFSDNGPTHNSTKGKPLKAEVHAMSYAYRRGTLMDYVVYYEYEVINKSGADYHDVRMGLWNGGDRREFTADYIAFDSARRVGVIFYQYMAYGTAPSGGLNVIVPGPLATGISIVAMPGDEPGNYKPVNSYVNFPAYGTYWPRVDTQFNHLMRCKSAQGEAFVMPHDGWVESHPGLSGVNRYSILSTNDFNLRAGGKAKAVFALVIDTTRSNELGYRTDTIHIVADTAWQLYHTQVGVPAVGRGLAGLQVYPNPAQGVLHIAGMLGSTTYVVVYNVLGQPVGPAVAVRGAEATIAVGHLPAGTYMVTASGVQGMARAVFVKE